MHSWHVVAVDDSDPFCRLSAYPPLLLCVFSERLDDSQSVVDSQRVEHQDAWLLDSDLARGTVSPSETLLHYRHVIVVVFIVILFENFLLQARETNHS